MNGLRSAGKGTVVATAFACLVSASSALAGYQQGGFSGTSEQLEPITFRADEDRVRRLAVVLYAECADSTRQKITVEKGRTDIDGDDRFSLELTGASELKVEVAGRLKGERAGGRIVATVKPPGTTCRADTRWAATLAKPAS
jgi:hypothetical protein